MTTAIAGVPPTLHRLERFGSVGSTNDVVRQWLAAGEPEICVAVADEQSAGRGRGGRTWIAPPGGGLLVSLGFRPAWLSPDKVWRLAASASLAMAEAAEDAVRLPAESIRLKWPNDLVIDVGSHPKKLAGVLGETDGLGSAEPRAIVGLGINTDWPASDFPPDLAGSMTSLREASANQTIDAGGLLEGFLARLESRVGALHDGHFDEAGWTARQVTTGREIDVTMPDGTTDRLVARGVDPATGALRVASADPGSVEAAREWSLVVGEIRHVRLAGV